MCVTQTGYGCEFRRLDMGDWPRKGVVESFLDGVLVRVAQTGYGCEFYRQGTGVIGLESLWIRLA